MSALQRLLYNKLGAKQLGLHNQMIQYRKACNHPLLFHPVHQAATSARAASMRCALAAQREMPVNH